MDSDSCPKYYQKQSSDRWWGAYRHNYRSKYVSESIATEKGNLELFQVAEMQTLDRNEKEINDSLTEN